MSDKQSRKYQITINNPVDKGYTHEKIAKDAGILSSSGKVSNAIKSGVSQGDLVTAGSEGTGYTPTGSSGSSAAESSSNSGSSVTVPTHSETEGHLVWVPTNGGTKYHSRSSCSQMIDPIQVSIETAIANGYTACGRCH